MPVPAPPRGGRPRSGRGRAGRPGCPSDLGLPRCLAGRYPIRRPGPPAFHGGQPGGGPPPQGLRSAHDLRVLWHDLPRAHQADRRRGPSGRVTQSHRFSHARHEPQVTMNIVILHNAVSSGDSPEDQDTLEPGRGDFRCALPPGPCAGRCPARWIWLPCERRCWSSVRNWSSTSSSRWAGPTPCPTWPRPCWTPWRCPTPATRPRPSTRRTISCWPSG